MALVSRSAAKPCLERLEDRRLLSVCHVTRLSDTGAGVGFRGDLRYCINQTNIAPGPDTIDFNVTGTINLNGELPHLSDELTIAGSGANQLTIRRDTGGDYRIFTIDSGVTVQIRGIRITNGFPQGDFPNQYKGRWGGGIYNSGLLTLEAVAVIGNVSNATTQPGIAPRGGGVFNEGTATIVNSTIAFNTTVDACVSHPQCAAYGGGVANHPSGKLSIFQSTIAHNTVSSGGSAESSAYGGGVSNHGVAAMHASTVTANGAFNSLGHQECGGGIWGGDFLVKNSIISGNSGTGPPGHDVCGQHTDAGFNLIQRDARLGPLKDNGGPTPTVALLPGSPAIDFGDNTDAAEFDQRGPGFPRIVNGRVDIGAFEVQTVATTTAPAGFLALYTADFDVDGWLFVRALSPTGDWV